ncbi:MAG: hypothetical protein AVO34_01955 [Firmicutes bacterium ML8_F2]|jgi:UDP-N-acetylmuramoyl-tripeptide--D-alanyl-D-alanine ligase|nr:MAG: hypothetical protein AVO34_01955 [Firmicutes bacterium ML8_F2]
MFKNSKMRSILQYILKVLAQIILWRYKPEIVAVTGSVGKTGAKEAIYHVLKGSFRTRRNIKNYNNEIGVPLTILGQDIAPQTKISAIFPWLTIFFKACLTIIWQRKYPEVLVLEMGISHPGDMKYLVNFAPAKVGVITAIGEFPTHLEFFPEKDRLIKEKAFLVKHLTKQGTAVLNYDDLSVRMIGDELGEKTNLIQYGFGNAADLKILNYNLLTGDLDKGNYGISFKLEYNGSVVPFRLNKILGKQHAFAAAAAASVGLVFGMNLVEISHSLSGYHSLPGRAKLLKGVKNTWLIDDTYNASPLATLNSLDILDRLAAGHPGRKIVVLGDMLELGIYTEDGHRRVGREIPQIADLLFTVGAKANFIAEEAANQGFNKNKIFKFYQPEKAGLALQKELVQGDFVLIKGSRGIHMEKIVKEIMRSSEKADELLVH